MGLLTYPKSPKVPGGLLCTPPRWGGPQASTETTALAPCQTRAFRSVSEYWPGALILHHTHHDNHQRRDHPPPSPPTLSLQGRVVLTQLRISPGRDSSPASLLSCPPSSPTAVACCRHRALAKRIASLLSRPHPPSAPPLRGKVVSTHLQVSLDHFSSLWSHISPSSTHCSGVMLPPGLDKRVSSILRYCTARPHRCSITARPPGYPSYVIQSH